MKKLIITTVAALALSTGIAVAQDAMAPANVSFVDADADKTGDVTLAEAQVVWPDLTQEAFTAADANKDGSLDQQEYDALAAGTTPPPSAAPTTEPDPAKDDKPADAPATP